MKTNDYLTKVSRGSIYNVKNKTNPLQMSFHITFNNGETRRAKVNGKTKEELLQKKESKILEILEEYKAEQKALETMKSIESMEPKELIKGYPALETPKACRQMKPITFREVSEMWFKEFSFINESKGNSFSNLDSARYSLKAINKVIGDMEISKIDRETAQRMINEISVDSKGNYRSKSHVEKAVRKFKAVMGYALEHEYIMRPLGRLYINKNVTEPNRDSRFVDEECLWEFLDCVSKNPFYNTLVNLILSSGLRQEEALALTIDDIKSSDDICEINVKKAVVEISNNRYEVIDRLKHGEKERSVAISKDVYDMLINYYNEGIKDKELMKKRKANGTEKMLFVNKAGRVHNKRTLYHSFRNYLERNIKTGGKEQEVRLHMLRHTFASYMANEVPIEKVSEILGHRDISITKRYYMSKTREDRKRISTGIENMMNKLKNQK